MATSDLTLEQIYNYFREKGNIVKNRELVNQFKTYLTDPDSKNDARAKFKSFVNILAQTKTENGEKYLMLKTKYQTSLDSSPKASPQRNPINSPLVQSSLDLNSPTRQPPPYRPPPPVTSPSSPSIDNISLCSSILSQDSLPQAPPRRKQKSIDEDCITPKNIDDGDDSKISVKERTQKFNRLASIEDELNPSPKRTPNEKKVEPKGVEEDDGASVTSLEPKKCVEWCVTASKGDLQELVKLAKDEPRLVNRKDPFTTVLHWGAKHGSAEIIKVFAGRYKVDVNSRTVMIKNLNRNFRPYFSFFPEWEADGKIRDYSGKLPEFYLLAKEQKLKDISRKTKHRKKQSEKDLGFLRIGSLNVRVKKTTEAFSNFLGVGNSGSINPLESMEKVHKGWGSADNLNNDNDSKNGKRKLKRQLEGLNSTPATPQQSTRHSETKFFLNNDSDSDSAAGFDSNWKN